MEQFLIKVATTVIRNWSMLFKKTPQTVLVKAIEDDTILIKITTNTNFPLQIDMELFIIN